MQSDQNNVRIIGHSVRGAERQLELTRGQPGSVAVTLYVREKPITIIVSVNQLRQALNRVS
jgi:hypothetical protein